MNLQQIGQTMIEVARAEVGVREQPLGSNRGVRVEEYQSVTSLAASDPTGWPWCAAFMVWCMLKTWKLCNIPAMFFFPRTASCDVILDWARQHNCLFDTPRPYDLFLRVQGAGDAVHTGLVTAVHDFTDDTIEGNTNNDGSREGIGVFEFNGNNARRRSDTYRYVRWLDVLAALQVAAPARLILSVPPYAGADYHALTTGELDAGTWTVNAADLASALGVSLASVAEPGRYPLRQLLNGLHLPVDELRTKLGNHTTDAAKPAQYVFISPHA